MKRLSMLASLFVLAVSLAVAVPGSASAASSGWCADTLGSTPCVLTATRDSVTVDHTDPHWNFQFNDFSGGGEAHWQWNLTYDGSIDVGSAEKSHQWDLTIDMGSVIPRVVFTRGDTVSIVRNQPTPGDSTVEVTANPVTLSNSCNQGAWPWTCVEAGDLGFNSWNGLLGGEVTDFGQWADVDQRNAIYGLDYSTNNDAVDIPPQLIGDPSAGTGQILVDLANAHYQPDGLTPFSGNFHLVIPKSYLRAVYGIDDPASLTGTGVVTTLSGTGGTVTASLDPSYNLVVDGNNLSFSARRVRIKHARIVPRVPRNLHGVRRIPTAARLTFDPARSRGSKVTGYVANCGSANDPHTRVGTAKDSPLVVHGLLARATYVCKAWATSRAGRGDVAITGHLKP